MGTYSEKILGAPNYLKNIKQNASKETGKNSGYRAKLPSQNNKSYFAFNNFQYGNAEICKPKLKLNSPAGNVFPKGS